VTATVVRSQELLTVLTSLRIVAIPVIMGLVIEGGHGTRGVAAALFAVAAVTDFADGYLARRWRLTTVLGSFLDTTADKLLVSAVLVALVQVGRASAWIAVIIIGRELLIMGLRGVVAASGTVFKPSIWGKAKANVQFLAILLAILRPDLALGPLLLDEWVMLLAGGITLMSAVEYLLRFGSSLRAAVP
jgi:CDP-diacylglycerol--glycerol-3-phosphate 3-phosphatidyltransferase